MGDEKTLYRRLRELAYEDPLATKYDFITLFEQDRVTALRVLEEATDLRGSRFRQIAARAVPINATENDVAAVLNSWLQLETDEFAITAINDALEVGNRTGRPRRQKLQTPPRPLELEGTYKYVSSRLRHRVLNALPGAGMTIRNLREYLNEPWSHDLVARISIQVDQLYDQLSRLEKAVTFDEESSYFQCGSIALMPWLRDHQIKFAREFAPITLDLRFESADNNLRVCGTPYWLETAITNLWKNSIDEVGRDQCKITMEATREGHEVHLAVRDNGPGLRESGFKRGFQFQYSSKSPERGRGHMEVADAMKKMNGSACVVPTDDGYRVQLRFLCSEP